MTHKKQGGKKDTVANDKMTHDEIMGKDRKAGNPRRDDHNPQFQSDRADIETRSQEGTGAPPGKRGGSGR
jgi:hypothetical protein